MKRVLLIGVLLLFGAGCNSASTDPTELMYHTVVLPKIDFAVELPEQWKESSITADPMGPADYHNFVVPPQNSTTDRVVGTLGFRLVPRIADNALEDEIESLKPFIEESAGNAGVFSEYTQHTVANADALQVRWQGVTKNEVEEVWYYTFAFVGDNLLVSYFFDETIDAEQFKMVYDRALATIEKR